MRLRDLAAIILALGVTATLIIIAVGSVIHTGPISTEESTLLSTALGAAVGAVATYLGLSRWSSGDPGPEGIDETLH